MLTNYKIIVWPAFLQNSESEKIKKKHSSDLQKQKK